MKSCIIVLGALLLCAGGSFAQLPMGEGADWGGMSMQMPDYAAMAKAEVDSIIVPLALDPTQVKKMVKLLTARSEAKANAYYSAMMNSMSAMMTGGGFGEGGMMDMSNFTMPQIDTAYLNAETRRIDSKTEKRVQAVLNPSQLELWNGIETEKMRQMNEAMEEAQKAMRSFQDGNR